MNGREGVLKAIDFQPIDRIPIDLDGMLSTGVNASVYPEFVREMGLTARFPRI